MARLNLSVTSLGALFLCSMPIGWAQESPSSPMNSITSAGIRDATTLDLTLPSVNDPAAVDMLFREGNTILSVLDGLKEKGFHLQYKEKHFLPSMTLLSLPKGSRIDEVLREILEPWNFKVRRSPLGQWIVAPNKKKVSTGTDPRTQELLEHYRNAQSSQDEEQTRTGD